MKKFFYFILAAVTMTLAACGPNEQNDPTDVPTQDQLKNFSVQVNVIAPDDVVAKITSTDQDIYFEYGHTEVENFSKFGTREFLQKWLKEEFSDYTYPDELHQGEYLSHPNVEPGHKYIMSIFQVGPDYTIVGDIEYKLFETPAK